MKAITKTVLSVFTVLICTVLPLLSEAQMGGPIGFGGQGGLPDQGNKPGDVPFDGTFSLVLVAAGIFLAITVFRRANLKKELLVK